MVPRKGESMSWGERSCIHLSTGGEPRPCTPEIAICNVHCVHYQWDDKTPFDSGTHEDHLAITGKEDFVGAVGAGKTEMFEAEKEAPKKEFKPFTKNQRKRRNRKAKKK